MQKPTPEAIKEQVSEELDEHLPSHVLGLVVESALKTSSKKKRRVAAKRKNRSTQGTTPQNTVQNSEAEYVEEVSGFTESGEIEEKEQSSNISTINSIDRATFNTYSSGHLNTGPNRGRNQARGRSR